MINKIKQFFNEHKNLGEIFRFLIVGTIATLVDMFMMGVAMYFIQREIYPTFINTFINTPTPSTFATVMGTAVGFVSGLIVNYVLSIFFVFNEKGSSRSAKGFLIFTILSAIGLGLNMLGMYIGFDLMHINQWVTKIIVTIIVLVYNYVSRRLILFKNKPNKQEAPNQNNNL